MQRPARFRIERIQRPVGGIAEGAVGVFDVLSDYLVKSISRILETKRREMLVYLIRHRCNASQMTVYTVNPTFQSKNPDRLSSLVGEPYNRPTPSGTRRRAIHWEPLQIIERLIDARVDQ